MLRPTILQMKPGTRVVSHSFSMDDWEPDGGFSGSSDDCKERCLAYFWVVPARVAGAWQTPDGTLRLDQKFQKFTGTLTNGGKTLKIDDGRVRGEAFTFTAGGVKYEGTMQGRTMTIGRGQGGLLRLILRSGHIPRLEGWGGLDPSRRAAIARQRRA